MTKTAWNLDVMVVLGVDVFADAELGVASGIEYVHNAGEMPTLRLGPMKWRGGGAAAALSEQIATTEQLARDLDQVSADRDRISTARSLDRANSDNLVREIKREADKHRRELAAARDELERRDAERTELANQLIGARRRMSVVSTDRTALRQERDHLRVQLEQHATRLTESDREIVGLRNDERALKDERDELRSRLDTAVGYDTEQADRVAAKIRKEAADMRQVFNDLAGEMGRASTNVINALRHGMGLPPVGVKDVARDETTNSETVVTNPWTSNRLAVNQVMRIHGVAPGGPPIERTTWDDTVQLATVTMPDGTEIQAEARYDDLGNLTLRPRLKGEAAQRLADALAASAAPDGYTPRPLDMDQIRRNVDAMTPAERAAADREAHEVERQMRADDLRSELEELVLDFCGYVDGAEVSADGSAGNDLADERRGACMAVLDYFRRASVLTGAIRITESERGGWHVMPLAGPANTNWSPHGDRRRWRVGAHYGVHLYAELPDGGSEPIGTMFRDELAQQVVDEHNRNL